jgi:anti-anti-sigma factor
VEITRQQSGELLEVKVKGRLDAYWADHLATELADVIREGARHVRLNLADVVYLSSAGIGVLVQTYKQLRGLQGSFLVSNPSERVKAVLELTRLTDMLVLADAPAAPAVEARPAGLLERDNARFEVFAGAPGASLTCRVVGDPTLLIGCHFGREHCQSMSLPEGTMALGLGAFGQDFEDAQDRFGEFLGVAGAAVYAPTDGTNAPDYMLATGELVPEVKVLYAVTCQGRFARVAHFERTRDGGPVSLTDVVEAGFEMAGADTIGLALVAESAGLMGAVLRRSPALAAAEAAPFAHPEIREWLSFTAERAYARCSTLVVGVATRAEHEALAPFVRPLGSAPKPAGHFHAAAFSYRPLRKGEVDLAATVSALFEAEALQGVLHLLSDDREMVGAGQSEFVRGACWVSPISGIV